jgi:pimeloyl-ACP methyl ester carboxylesterase
MGRLQKRGQISLFVIVGLIIVLSVLLIGYMSSSVVKKRLEAEVETTAGLSVETLPVKNYVESCLKKVAYEGLIRAGLKGGYINVPDIIEAEDTSYWYFDGVDIHPSLEEIRQRLEDYININLQGCTDFSVFEEQGYLITTENLSTEVNFGVNDLSIRVDYPITVKREEFEQLISDFQVKFDVRFRKMYEIGEAIVIYVALEGLNIEDIEEEIVSDMDVGHKDIEEGVIFTIKEMADSSYDKDYSLQFATMSKKENISIDLGFYLKMCGDDVCQSYESYDICSQDCPSGVEDGFCDRIVDGICDPDCSMEMDLDCKKEVKVEKEISSNKLPCTKVVRPTREDRVVLKKTDIRDLEIPKNYSVIVNPFSLDCDKESLYLTFNIPDNYVSVKALKCREGVCDSLVFTRTSNLECGEEILEGVLREERYLDIDSMDIELREVEKEVTGEKAEISSDKFSIRFIDLANTLSVRLEKPRTAEIQPRNPSLRIIGTPLIVRVDGTVKKPLATQITMPYLPVKEVDENSIAIYGRVVNNDDVSWEYIGGKINKEEEKIEARIDDLNRYLMGREAHFAVMGVVCISCLGSSFNKIYSPKVESRKAVVLVHGLASSPETFRDMIDDIRLSEQPWQVWTFAYPSDKSTEKNAKEFANQLEINSNEYDSIYFISHSLGGLITQQALYDSYNENKEIPGKYSYLSKVKKVILVATPGEGSPTAELYLNLFRNLINLKSRYNVFNLYGKGAKEVVNGKIIPRVPGIEYYVVAGTRPYDFNLGFFKKTIGGIFYEPNDGIINVKSAQNVGGEYINNKCENYWEINTTHTELIDNVLSRRIIERIVAKEIIEESLEEEVVMGYNQYFEMSIFNCNPKDKYVIIGKKIERGKLYDPTGCSCGNGVCGIGENRFNCPSDCARLVSLSDMFSPRRVMKFLLPIVISLISFLMIVFVIFQIHHRRRK